ncbi:MAG: hypothetical protein A3B37_02345 [Candidatus Sungbacteria bacterium RIFCSPLOWO2_01_FULL_59_16]|uniref:Uncharacterized protein n=1 Tax=Candidatus Sungbacteria bacterium RIFCSPLOWO2_01_FULL_59_16 TaxID=1802280 RepID=A0A1G2LCQ1_9BACT|nr:MAG: hypothetical protein A3B37_02345 [Candidatus Sungbacteria bacterium RIFCSPLOWO2_01_FULL_59_16]
MKYRAAIGISILLLIGIAVFFHSGPTRQEPVREPTAPAAKAAEQVFASREDRQGSVTVTVTPRALSPSVATWDFAIILDTHTTDLAIDVLAAAVLRASKGNAYPPIRWEGDPPGGHHREGILRFAPISPRPASLTLVIRELDGIAERSFAWELEK